MAPTSPPSAPSAVPLIVKTARLGYDGKGQRPVSDAAGVARGVGRARSACPASSSNGCLSIVEVSVVLARHRRRSYGDVPGRRERPPPGHPRSHRGPGTSRSGDRRRGTASSATRIAEALDYVGVLAVEMFVSDGQLFVNELAPRPHNSGHWTLDAAATSQFAQQIRAVTGCRARRYHDDVTGRGDGQPARRPVVSADDGETRRTVRGRRSWPTRAPDCTCTARRHRDRVARWVISRCSATVADEVAERVLTLREGVVPKSNELRRAGRRRRWTDASPARAHRGSVRRRRAAPAPARRRRRPAGHDRGEPRPPPPVHAVGRSGPRDHRNVRLQGRRGLVDRRELQLSGHRTGRVRRRRSGARRLRTPPARRTGIDRDRLLAAPGGRRPRGDDRGRRGADVLPPRPSTASSASRSAAT